jgi:hypothetical protein
MNKKGMAFCRPTKSARWDVFVFALPLGPGSITNKNKKLDCAGTAPPHTAHDHH